MDDTSKQHIDLTGTNDTSIFVMLTVVHAPAGAGALG